MNNKAYLNAFNKIPFIGPKKINSLMQITPNIEEAWNLPVQKLKMAEGWINIADKFVKERAMIDVEKEWEKIEKSGIKVIAFNEPDYPSLLKEIYLPPTILYIHGELNPEEKSLAIVGSRKSTVYGKEIAIKFACELAAVGITVVSGMAMGIDTWAHKGAVDAGGRTIAVLGSGVDICYPSKNFKLKNEISLNGAVVSEFPLGTTPIPQNFPRRNRIISGLSMGTIVVEAMERSGALITADFALEQGREVFAVPGNVNSPYSKGCNRLIKQGAKLVEKLDDIIEEFDIFVNKKNGEKENAGKQLSFLSEEEEKILSFVAFQPVHIDEIIQQSKMAPALVNGTLLNLELKGLIKQVTGKYFIRLN